MSGMKLFRVSDKPGYHESGIPWEMIAAHERQADRNHSQTLNRLHERGGLSWSESLAVLQDRRWEPEPNAKALVLALVEQWIGHHALPPAQSDGEGQRNQ